MRTIIKLSLICSLCIFYSITKAQVIYDDTGISVGRETYTPIYFGDEWSIDEWEEGINFWRAWPYANSGNYKIFIDKTGLVGIGRKPTTYKLEVAGNVFTAGRLLISSDAQLKKEVKTLDKSDCLYRIKLLNGKSYEKKEPTHIQEDYEKMISVGKITQEQAQNAQSEILTKTKKEVTSTEFGFLAQDLKELFPELVFEDAQGYLSVDYPGLIPILVEAIKMQNEQIIANQIEIDKTLKTLSNFTKK